MTLEKKRFEEKINISQKYSAQDIRILVFVANLYSNRALECTGYSLYDSHNKDFNTNNWERFLGKLSIQYNLKNIKRDISNKIISTTFTTNNNITIYNLLAALELTKYLKENVQQTFEGKRSSQIPAEKSDALKANFMELESLLSKLQLYNAGTDLEFYNKALFPQNKSENLDFLKKLGEALDIFAQIKKYIKTNEIKIVNDYFSRFEYIHSTLYSSMITNCTIANHNESIIIVSEVRFKYMRINNVLISGFFAILNTCLIIGSKSLGYPSTFIPCFISSAIYGFFSAEVNEVYAKNMAFNTYIPAMAVLSYAASKLITSILKDIGVNEVAAVVISNTLTSAISCAYNISFSKLEDFRIHEHNSIAKK